MQIGNILKKETFLFLISILCINCYAQQWVDKQYVYDSTLNVTYGRSVNFAGDYDTLKMDIYQPDCDSLTNFNVRPLLLFVHGGAFVSGDKSEQSITNLCKQFARRGYVTASINYRLGFISDDQAWNCNYPNYSCVFASDSSEWYRAYYRAVQDGKGALHYLLNRRFYYQIDIDNIFIAGESAGAIVALGIGLLDTINEKPMQAYAIPDAPRPSSNTTACPYNKEKTFFDPTVKRPDLGGINGNLQTTDHHYTIKAIGNMYGAMLNDLLKYSNAGKPKPAIFSFHQPCDLVVPIDSGGVFSGLSWCLTNGYNCLGVSNTAKLYGSRAFSQWNSNNNYGYSIHNDFTTKAFPYSFLFGEGSCADQINNPCHAYDNALLRENNLAQYFAPLVTTLPLCMSDTTSIPVAIDDHNHEVSNIKIYPNPTSEFVSIKCKEFYKSSVAVYNLLGELMQPPISLHHEITQINFNDFRSGIYILVLKRKDGRMKVSRVVKE